MKNFVNKLWLVIAFVCMFAGFASAQNVPNYTEQGGSRDVIRGSIDIASGGEIDIESGGAFKLGGVEATPDAAQYNVLDITTPGTGANSKAVVLDSSGDYTYPATGTIVYPSSSTLTASSGSTVNIAGTFQIGGAGMTATAAELNLVDGTVEGNTVASKVPLLDANKALQTNGHVGTAGTNVTAVEFGDGFNHVTVLTVTASPLTPTTIPADAEGAGVIIYTFPAGVHVFTGCHMDVTAFTGTGFAATNAVDIGIGSLISSGDIATLTTAAMEDCVTGQTIADISSPAKEKSTIATAGAPLLFESSGSKVIHLNIAGTWNDTFTAPVITGTVTLYWTFLGE